MATSSEKFDLIVRARDEASSKIRGIGKSVIGMVSAFAAIRGATEFLKDSIQLASESEQVYGDLEAALRRHGQAVEANIPIIREFTSEMQTMTGISDEAIAKSVQAFIDYGATTEQALNRVRVATDLAVGGNMNLASATDLVAKASVGYTSTLSRYGIIIEESIPKSEKFAAAIDQIKERFGGAAQARIDDFATKTKVLTQRWGDFKELIGKYIATEGTALNDLVGNLSGLIEKINERLAVATDPLAKARERLRDLQEQELQLRNLIINSPSIINSLLGRGDELSQIIDQIEAQKGLIEGLKLIGNTEITVPQIDVPEPAPFDYSGYADQIAGVTTEVEKLNTVAYGPTTAELIRGRWDTEQEAIRAAEDAYARLRDSVAANVNQMIVGAIDQFVFMKESLDKIFADILRSFSNMILQMTLQRAATRAADFLLTGPLGFLGLNKPALGGASTAGVGGTGGFTNEAAPRMVTINFNGPIIGEEEYIRGKIAPVLERDATLYHNRLAVRG